MNLKKCILILVILSALLLSACNASDAGEVLPAAPGTTAPETQPEQETQPVQTEQEDSDVYEGDAFTYYTDTAYAAQLDRYHTALSQTWEEGAYFENGMSNLAYYYYEGNPLDNLGFTFLDLDGDGILELIIGAIANAQNDPAVLEIWTLREGTAEMLVQSGSRNRYFLEFDGEHNTWWIANEASNGAANSANHYYKVTQQGLEVIQAVIFDAQANEAQPWFLAMDDDWDTANDSSLDEDTALRIMESHRRLYCAPEYIPFSLYG